jgi:hypothetical protein
MTDLQNWLVEFLFLTLSEVSCLPPLCPNRINGRCPMQD